MKIRAGVRTIQNANYRQRQSYDALNKDHRGIRSCNIKDELDNIEEHTNNIIITSKEILDVIHSIRAEGVN